MLVLLSPSLDLVLLWTVQNNNNNYNAFQLVMSQVPAGQVWSLQSSLSCASL